MQVYIEIGEAELREVKSEKLDKEISCLDMHPIGPNPDEVTMAVRRSFDYDSAGCCHKAAHIGHWLSLCKLCL